MNRRAVFALCILYALSGCAARRPLTPASVTESVTGGVATCICWLVPNRASAHTGGEVVAILAVIAACGVSSALHECALKWCAADDAKPS